eukprot:CAMPEP_0184537958 /NCGR_PEP_ID=MMETSP0198_2-20121128/17342_1 /TAXON_ID=1112570 /ORGANISM="Thraustochytrium sp., Strain LLF1b" /LENGTH=268 /DNA_ID=CAMNT_0026931385 /DNA_START=617 /DNA_END=1423 /DNA_ORIENTATION=+
MYGVFDGHGGDQAAQYCADHLGPLLASCPIDAFRSPREALEHTFKLVDEKFLEVARLRNLDDGTTALVALANQGTVTVANTGDSRAVMIKSNGHFEALSNDHKPNREDERLRIEALDGNVIHWGVWRVQGVLAVSRAIGDRVLKNFVIPDPEVRTWECNPEDMYLVLATDGLWDVMDNIKVGKLCAGCRNAQEAAEILTQEAFAQGTMDNVTVLVVDVRNAGFSKSTPSVSSATSSTSSTMASGASARSGSESSLSQRTGSRVSSTSS